MKALILVAAFVVGACSPLDPDTSHPLRVSARDAALQLANVSGQRVFYFTYEREGAALINWAPCVADETWCHSVAPGGQATVPYSSIGGYAPGKTEAIVWWWYAVPGPATTPVPGEISAIVRL